MAASRPTSYTSVYVLFRVLVSALLVLEVVVRIDRSFGLASIDLAVLASGTNDGLDLLLGQ